MIIVVTGGVGFIGSNFVYYMLEKRSKDTIICLDKLPHAGDMVITWGMTAVTPLPRLRFTMGWAGCRKRNSKTA